MAGALGCYGAWTVDHVISFLVSFAENISVMFIKFGVTNDLFFFIRIDCCYWTTFGKNFGGYKDRNQRQ